MFMILLIINAIRKFKLKEKKKENFIWEIKQISNLSSISLIHSFDFI